MAKTFSADELMLLKRKFNDDLEPMKAMLAHRKSEFSLKNWLEFVTRTRLSILSHPDQFLSKEIPAETIYTQVINQIFEEFIKHEVSQRDLKNI